MNLRRWWPRVPPEPDPSASTATKIRVYGQRRDAYAQKAATCGVTGIIFGTIAITAALVGLLSELL